MRSSVPAAAPAVLALAVVSSGCGDGPTDPGSDTGALAVTATTGGSGTLDPDGYRMAAGGDTARVPPSGTGVIAGLGPGQVEVGMSDVQRNCRTGGRTATASISAGDTAELSFSVTCDTALLGKVVFVSDRGGSSDVWVANPDGSDAARLTDHSASEGGPEVSPDGTRIVFWSNRTGDQELYTIRADGSGLVRVTSADGSNESGPAWAPDGGRIAFVSDRSATTSIYTTSPDTGGVRQVTRDQGNELTVDWSPDGSRFLFNSDRSGSLALYTSNLDGSGLQQIPGTDSPESYTPAWGPGESGIALTAGGGTDFDITTIAVDGSGRTIVADSDSADQRPAWSPDGSRLLFESNRTGDFDVFSVAANGTGLVNLTNDPGYDVAASFTPPPDDD